MDFQRSAKLKQCKLDARREQWLSQSVLLNYVFALFELGFLIVIIINFFF